MNRIWIVFEKDRGFVPRVIRWLTKSDFNHVAIEYDSDDWNGRWAAEAATKGVRTVPSSKRKWTRRFLVKYPEAKIDLRSTSQFIGEAYDFAGFFLFGWILLFWRVLKLKVRRPWRSTKGQFCSEFVARFIGVQDPFSNPQWVTPEDIFRRCCIRSDMFEEERI